MGQRSEVTSNLWSPISPANNAKTQVCHIHFILPSSEHIPTEGLTKYLPSRRQVKHCCHPERSEGSVLCQREILRSAQDDRATKPPLVTPSLCLPEILRSAQDERATRMTGRRSAQDD